MLQLLAVACLVAVGLAEPGAEPGAEPAAAASPLYIHVPDEHIHHEHHHDEHIYEPKKIHVSEDILKKQHKIIESVYSPDYYEPSLILDYRYLKSGGRDYTRGPGGQILILPHGVRSHETKHHRDYDSLIEFLRLRHLAQTEARREWHEEQEHHRHHHHADAKGHEHHDGHGHHSRDHGHHGQEHGHHGRDHGHHGHGDQWPHH